MEDIKSLSCSAVLHFFDKISKIPRGSGKEKKISDYLVDFAKKRGLWCHQDKALNVIIKKPASKGFENSPTFVIQGHMDMVCVKTDDAVHNFDTDPIKLIYDGDFIKADNTTLGADDGIAVAMALAILDSDKIEHPPLEVLITTDEEVGMIGAQEFDENLLDGKILLNIDSEDEGIFTAGCAGGVKTTTKFNITREAIEKNLSSFRITVSGLKGGHSGIDIDKERGNAIRILARALNKINKNIRIRIGEIFGGAKDNAIPSYAQALVCIEEKNKDILFECINKFEKDIKNEFRNSDNGVFLSVTESKNPENVLSDYDCQRILKTLITVPNGVQSLSTDIENLVESSNNIGVIKTDENSISFVCAVRSSLASRKYYIFEQIKAISELANAEFTYRGDYPAWEFKPDSVLRDKMVEIYKKMFNTEPVVNIIHAGLECGIFAKKLPDMDMISFGPNLYDVHSVKERLSISSVDRTWEFLLEILKSYKG